MLRLSQLVGGLTKKHPTWILSGITFFGLCQFVTRFYPLKLQHPTLYHLCHTRLHGKVVLGKGYFWFAWVTVLSNQVTSVAGEHIIGNFTLCSFGKFYHFPGAGKMIRRVDSCILTGLLSSCYNAFKSFPLGIPKQSTQLTSTPALNAIILASYRFKLIK